MAADAEGPLDMCDPGDTDVLGDSGDTDVLGDSGDTDVVAIPETRT